jgi:hypothetical protein
MTRRRTLKVHGLAHLARLYLIAASVDADNYDRELYFKGVRERDHVIVVAHFGHLACTVLRRWASSKYREVRDVLTRITRV